MKELPKAEELLPEFSGSPISPTPDDYRIQFAKEYTKRVLDYVVQEYRHESNGLTFYKIMSKIKSELK